ncbi:MAG: hypothetical protein ACREC6_06865 [Hyphomicrobiaceae bacterium]
MDNMGLMDPMAALQSVHDVHRVHNVHVAPGLPKTDAREVAMPDAAHVKHFRQIVVWPLYLLPLKEGVQIQNHWEHLTPSAAGNPWREPAGHFTSDSAAFQERHYNEFVTFLPSVQRFLYGQPAEAPVRRSLGESPIKIMRRTDIAKARVTLNRGGEPWLFDVARVDLYFFFDIDIVMLVLEVFSDDMPLAVAQDMMFRSGRAYPAYWEADGRGGHCPWRVEWLGTGGEVLAVSDYEEREKYLAFVRHRREPCVAAHWTWLLRPLVPHHSDEQGLIRYRQLEYYRMPRMAYLAMDDMTKVTRADYVRLAFADGPGDPHTLPLSESYLKDFEQRYCYDRQHEPRTAADRTSARYLCCGDVLTVVGEARNRFFADPDGGALSRFRHQHFLLFLIAHFHKAVLRMLSDRFGAAVGQLDIDDPSSVRNFRRDTRQEMEIFLRFTHRYWFHEASRHTQAKELFDLCRKHLELDAHYEEIREEVQDMSHYLDIDAFRRQSNTMVRLTVVTIFGLVGTVTTGFLGMNLIAAADWSMEWKAAFFLGVPIPTAALTLYTVVKSRRLSEFLDALSDERVSAAATLRALLAVWHRKQRAARGP